MIGKIVVYDRNISIHTKMDYRGYWFRFVDPLHITSVPPNYPIQHIELRAVNPKFKEVSYYYVLGV